MGFALTDEFTARGFLKQTSCKVNMAGVYSFLDQGLLSFLSLATTLLAGRFCGKEELGLYALGLSIIIFFSEFQSAIIATPYLIHSPHLKGDSLRQYRGSVLIHQLAFSTLSALFLSAALGVVSSGASHEGMGRVLAVLVPVIGMVLAKEFLRSLCYASLNPGAALLLDSSVSLIQLTCLILLAFYGNLSASKTFAVTGVACGMTSLVWLIANKDVFSLKIKKALPAFTHNWALIQWLAASHILWSVSKALFPWIIAAFAGLESNGVWTACFGVASIGNMVLVGMQNIAAPCIMHSYAGGGTSEMRRLVYRYVAVFSFIMFLFLLIVIFSGDSLVELFYGEEYRGNGLLLSVIALNLFVAASTFPFSRGLFAMKRVDIDFKVNIAGIPMLAVTVYLVHRYGLIGAACGMTASSAISVLLRWILFEKVSGSQVKEIKEHSEEI